MLKMFSLTFIIIVGGTIMENFKLFFEQLKPFVIVLVFIALLAVLVYVALLVKKLNTTILKVNSSVDLVNVALADVNHKLADLNPTIETVKTISNTVDSGFKAGNNAVGSVVGFTKKGVSGIRSAVNKVTGHNKK